MADRNAEIAPFGSVPGAADLAGYFWHEVILVGRDGPHRLGSYHGCDGINLWREGADYCYLWVEATVDHDMWASFLLDVRTKIGGVETRDYVFLDAGAGGLFEVECHNKPIRFDADIDDHIDHLREGLRWFTERVIGGVQRRSASAAQTTVGPPVADSDDAGQTVEALCDRVFSADSQVEGPTRQRAVLVAGMDALLAQAWDGGVDAAFRGAITRQNGDDVKRANPYRELRLPPPTRPPRGPIGADTPFA